MRIEGVINCVVFKKKILTPMLESKPEPQLGMAPAQPHNRCVVLNVVVFWDKI
jgi:hypothetical protein